MRKIKYLFAFSAVALLSLAACNSNKNPYGDLPEETDANLVEKIDIVSAALQKAGIKPGDRVAVSDALAAGVRYVKIV